MIIKQKNTSKRKLVIFILFCVLIGVTIGGIIVVRNNPTSTQATTEPAKPLFSFTGADGWQQGPSNETSMALFSKAAADGTSVCFTSIEYKTGTVDAAVEIQKNHDVLSGDGRVVSVIGVPMLMLRTATGDKQYQLHQFQISSPDPSQVMGGNELGYVQLSDGYIKILGNCNTAEQLSTTIPALQAYKFIASKK